MTTLTIAARTAALSLVATLALGTAAQAQTYKPGNCAVYAEMAADTVAKDKRFKNAEGKAAVKGLRNYAKAQRKVMKAGMADTYAQSQAFGWDKATVDKKIKEGEAAIRSGFRTPTMDADTLYMDHVQAVYACAEKAKTPAELGQEPTAMRATFDTLYAGVR